MQYLSAYALASLSGKEPTKDQVNAILKAGGCTADAAQVDAVFNSMKGKRVEEVIAKGLAKVNVGGGAPAAAKKDAKKEQPKKKVEKAPEPEKEEEEENFGDLFG